MFRRRGGLVRAAATTAVVAGTAGAWSAITRIRSTRPRIRRSTTSRWPPSRPQPRHHPQRRPSRLRRGARAARAVEEPGHPHRRGVRSEEEADPRSDLPRRGPAPAGPRRAQIVEMLTGEVAIHASVTTKTAQPMPTVTWRSAPALVFRAHTGEEERHREQHDAEHVVRSALDVAPRPCREHLPGIEARRVGGRRQLVLRHGEGRQRRGWVLQRRVAIQAFTAGLNSVRNRLK